MTETLFILTTIFVAYVVRAVLDEKKQNSRSATPTADPVRQVTHSVKPVVETASQVIPQAIKPSPADSAIAKTEVTVGSENKMQNVAPIKPKTVSKSVPKKEPKKTDKLKKPDTKAVTAKKSTTSVVKPQVDKNKQGLKDPKTGEVTKSYTNYYFAKRWIKEALVTEGLLEKVYKNNEIDATTEKLIKDAIAKLENMEKYQA